MDQDERDFIRQSARRIEEWENTPRVFDDPYSEMTSEQKSQALLAKDEMIRECHRQNAELMAKLDDVTASLKESNSNMAQMTAALQSVINDQRAQLNGQRAQLKEANAMLKKLTEENAALKARTVIANKDRYGSKSQKGSSKKKQPKSKEEQKDDFDGTSGSAPVATDETSATEAAGNKPRSAAQLTADMLRTGSTYRRMGASTNIKHKTDLSLLPPGAVVINIIDKYAYEEQTRLIEHNYQIVVYKLGDRIIQAWLPAEGEPEVIDSVPGTHASSDLLAHLAFNRFVLDTPLYREKIRLNDEGMRLSRKTLTNWLHKGSVLLTPVVEQLKGIALEKDSIINCDETWCRVKVFDQYRKRYIWCLVNKLARIVIYCYEDGSRGRDALKSILGNAELRALQSDGYNVYVYLDKELTDIDHICCMAHARAKFRYALDAGEGEDCQYILDCIAELYALEKTYVEAGLTSGQIGQARKSPAALDIIGRLRSKLNVLTMPDHPPGGELMNKAVNYLDTFWKQIFRYIEDGRYSIDNNIAERFIRPLAGERKNSLFFGSHKMARASAVYHTVISTCRMMGYSAMDYLKKFFRRIVEGERDYSLLMPNTIGLSANKC